MNVVYGRGAVLYDALSGEWPVYRSGRLEGIRLLGLREGDTVLDVGCGTGLNFPMLVDAVGPTGRVIGLDRSSRMLEMAHRRISAHGWSTVEIVRADATDFSASDVGTDHLDAIFATYSLSVIEQWHAAWECMRRVLRRGGRAGIVDLALPSGAAAAFRPLARLACALGSSDADAHPWTMLQETGVDVRELSLRGGHIVVAAATIP
jgi:ubiquinone/menaquinone biosynthesis C-methylase UbiE